VRGTAAPKEAEVAPLVVRGGAVAAHAPGHVLAALASLRWGAGGGPWPIEHVAPPRDLLQGGHAALQLAGNGRALHPPPTVDEAFALGRPAHRSPVVLPTWCGGRLSKPYEAARVVQVVQRTTTTCRAPTNEHARRVPQAVVLLEVCDGARKDAAAPKVPPHFVASGVLRHVPHPRV